ncbi:nitrate reductase [Thioalkalivibrio sulfidiphilus]|uniref:nitrate reductase n=1 Tax=Thioalkalivibrio sulfidiphilus TaxID=1033854 RepID=UPI00037E506A|nr:nitrate reductase [Thioalkalivibrio sulfidiphilus]
MSGRLPVRTTCPYCGVGCGVRVSAEGGRYRVEGDTAHPANRGRLCSKGAALAETLHGEGRLLHPIVHGRQSGWDEALDTVADGFRRIIDAHGPEAVAFYVSGQLLTEDYYLANKLMKGFIGSANIDTNSRLCMSSAVAAHTRAFGTDTVPGCYEDIELADLVVIVGANSAWAHPVLFQRLSAAKQARPQMRVVVVDPRRTPTCEIADLHLPLRPGSDAWLFNGLLHHLRREDALDLDYLERHVEGFAATLEAARQSAPSIPDTAARCGLPEHQVAEFFRLFTRHERVVTLFSQGINQSSSGVDKGNAIINMHLATGRIGRPGMGPFSLTGQPNAMGGREVGGLATQLAAHMGFDDPGAATRLGRFWGSDRVASKLGLKAVELFEAMAEGRVKAVWIMGTNPMVSLPDADRMADVLRACELVVVSDCMVETETTAFAHVLLPAATWGEKDGTVTNSERRISRQRAFMEPPGQARPDWWIIAQVARRMGFASAFDYQGPAEIFREHARLSGFENRGGRDFDISALADLDDADYQWLQPVQWPVNRQAPGGTPRLFADGRFFTGSGRARLVPVTPRLPAASTDDDYPLLLNSGRIRDQWHTMTRTGAVPRLSGHLPEPSVQIHPGDVARWGLKDGDLARIESARGAMLARVRLDTGQRPGSVFVPIHWSGPFARQARVGALVAAVTDPISGQPEFKQTPVRLLRLDTTWQGFLLTRRPLALPETLYRVRAAIAGGWRYELADAGSPPDWPRWLRVLVGEDGEWLEFEDRGGAAYRAACVRDGRLEAVLFIGRGSELPARDWLLGVFAEQTLAPDLRARLLAGRPAAGRPDTGPVVCACHGVGLNTLREAILNHRLDSVDAVGSVLKAGSGCGSCRPEIQALIDQAHTPALQA